MHKALYRHLYIGLIFFFTGSFGNVYLKETFITENSLKSWTYPVIESNLGKFRYVGQFRDFVAFRAIQTLETFKQYRMSRATLPFTNKNKTLILQYEVHYPMKYECGGADMKLIRKVDYNAALFNSKTSYAVRFGPDTCGFERKVLLELNINGTLHKWKKKATFPDNNVPQYFTLILKSDDTYKVMVNMTTVGAGKIEEDFTNFEREFIMDLDRDKKPADWDDRKFILDEDDSQPEYWNDEEVPDTSHPLLDDVLFPESGFQVPKQINKHKNRPWKPRLIRNPKYNGSWLGKPRLNPFYTGNLHDLGTIGAIGIDIWQPYAQVTFDNILLTDDPHYAERFANKTWRQKMRYMLSELTLADLGMKTQVMRDATLAMSSVDMSNIMSEEERQAMLRQTEYRLTVIDSTRRKNLEQVRRRRQENKENHAYINSTKWWNNASLDTFFGPKVCLSFDAYVRLWKTNFHKKVPDMCNLHK